MDNTQNFLDAALALVKDWSPKLLTAIIVLILGLWIIRLITGAISKLMKRREVDVSLQGFLRGLISMTLKILLLISVAGWLGQQQCDAIDYLREENRVLREQLGGRRLRLNDDQ